MKHIPEDKYEREEAERLGAQPWMIEQLALNPGYTGWGPHEDYMCDRESGWRAPVIAERWGEQPGLDHLNEVVNFYFSIERDGRNCDECDGSGYNPETKSIADDWYDFAKTGRRWDGQITQDEAQALWDAGRLRPDFKELPTADEVNRWAAGRGLGRDAINRMICVEARAKRLGKWGLCAACEGHGYVYTAPECRLALVLWVLHPRKGASRGWEIKDVRREELPAVYEYLSDAAKRNAERFSKIPAPVIA